MDQLQEILSTFDENELVDLKKFLKSGRNRKDRKDLILVDWLLKNTQQTTDYLITVYQATDKKAFDAYHASRRRLNDQVRRFTRQQNRNSSLIESDIVEDWLTLGLHLIDHERHKLGWKHIERAERLASDAQLYNKLHRIYNICIEHAAKPFAPRLADIEIKRAANRLRIDEEERVNMAASHMKIKLNQVRLKAEDVDMMHMLAQTLDHYQLEMGLLKEPQIIQKFARIVRSAFLANKDYYGFEPHIIQLNELASQVDLSKAENCDHLAELKYMLCHTLYRNKKFDQAHQILTELQELISIIPKSKRKSLQVRVIMLLAAVESFRGENLKAVDLLEEYKDHKHFRLTDENRANLHLNLAVYYFQQDRFSDANSVLIHFPSSAKWCELNMGREWLFKKELIEMIIQYEMGNVDIALSRHRSILRRFSDLLKMDKYQKGRLFLTAVRSYINDPQKWVEKGSFSQMRRAIALQSWDQEDLQAMTYYAWLKSKHENISYYQSLLETVRS